LLLEKFEEGWVLEDILPDLGLGPLEQEFLLLLLGRGA